MRNVSWKSSQIFCYWTSKYDKLHFCVLCIAEPTFIDLCLSSSIIVNTHLHFLFIDSEIFLFINCTIYTFHHICLDQLLKKKMGTMSLIAILNQLIKKNTTENVRIIHLTIQLIEFFSYIQDLSVGKWALHVNLFIKISCNFITVLYNDD